MGSTSVKMPEKGELVFEGQTTGEFVSEGGQTVTVDTMHGHVELNREEFVNDWWWEGKL